MSERISEATRGLELRLGTPILIFLIGFISLTADGQSPSPANSTTSVFESLVPGNVIIPIEVVSRLFPEITREANTGQNLTAVGKPKATRSVIYANSDSSKKVTITVDEYASASDASLAYEEAVQKSKIVPGFKPISAPNLGEHGFIGTVTQGEETHIGLGALNGTLIVGVTLAGYEPASDNTAKLISLAQKEEAAAQATRNSNRQN
jgi:hypothetical protein